MYGWCALPLVALLFHLYLPPGGVAAAGRVGAAAVVGARSPSWPFRC